MTATTTTLREFLEGIGQEVEDFEEETFLLFSQEIPSQNLGFIDSRSNTVDVVVHGQDISIRQSPSVLTSSRAGGTTGAVLWKITPLIAEWISSKETNPLWTSSILTQNSNIVELGCGISGLIPISLAPSINHYIATDQEYVQRLLTENLTSNAGVVSTSTINRQQGSRQRPQRPRQQQSRKPTKTSSSRDNCPPPSTSSSRTRNQNSNTNKINNITFIPLDWEHSDPSTLQSFLPTNSQDTTTTTPTTNNDTDTDTNTDNTNNPPGFDLLLACDCIYNNTLITPFIRTCADICRLRPSTQDQDHAHAHDHDEKGKTKPKPTICVIAQHLRSPEVFEPWLREAMALFHVWRVRDEVLVEGLKGGRGCVVHVLVLKGGCGGG